ncbi:MAG: hypothetical protein LHV68_09660 [Elusimicrobia bacterium]|nr:hypothetical protein [Candidatus Liberimonas magnetica]
MKKKALLICLIFCFLFNNSVALFAIDRQLITSAPCIATPGLEETSTVQAPFTVMNTLLRKGVPLFPEFKGPLSNKQKDTTDKDNLCLMSSTGNGIKYTCKFNKNLENDKTLSDTSYEKTFDRYLFYLKLLIGINSLFSFFILLFLVSLSKSNLPWEINNFYR